MKAYFCNKWNIAKQSMIKSVELFNIGAWKDTIQVPHKRGFAICLLNFEFGIEQGKKAKKKNDKKK